MQSDHNMMTHHHERESLSGAILFWSAAALGLSWTGHLLSAQNAGPLSAAALFALAAALFVALLILRGMISLTRNHRRHLLHEEWHPHFGSPDNLLIEGIMAENRLRQLGRIWVHLSVTSFIALFAFGVPLKNLFSDTRHDLAWITLAAVTVLSVVLAPGESWDRLRALIQRFRIMVHLEESARHERNHGHGHHGSGGAAAGLMMLCLLLGIGLAAMYAVPRLCAQPNLQQYCAWSA